MKPFFTAEDFDGCITGNDKHLLISNLGPESLGARAYIKIAELANAKLAPLLQENTALRALLIEAREMISSHEQLCGCQEQEECIKRIDAALGVKND